MSVVFPNAVPLIRTNYAIKWHNNTDDWWLISLSLLDNGTADTLWSGNADRSLLFADKELAERTLAALRIPEGDVAKAMPMQVLSKELQECRFVICAPAERTVLTQLYRTRDACPTTWQAYTADGKSLQIYFDWGCLKIQSDSVTSALQPANVSADSRTLSDSDMLNYSGLHLAEHAMVSHDVAKWNKE